jgi:membrane protein DedA with SNARE-associated domain
MIGLLMTGIAVLGALLGYTTGYAAGKRQHRSR